MDIFDTISLQNEEACVVAYKMGFATETIQP